MSLTKEKLSEKIKELRTSKGASQEELGKVLGKSHAAISDIERGITDVSVQELSLIADFFHTPISYFTEESTVQNFVSFEQHRYSKGISPQEKKLVDKSSRDFDKYLAELRKKGEL